MAFLELPTEILYLIATGLDTCSLSQLILTSQYFNVLLTPYLHKLAVQQAHGDFTPLHWAAWKSYLPLVKLILRLTNNANINKYSPNADGGSALNYAICTCRRSAGTFVARAADPNATGTKSTLNPYRGWAECEEIVEFLLMNGADPNLQDNDGLTALHKVLALDSTDSYDLVDILLENGAGSPLLLAAMYCGCVLMVRPLR
ncbi:uncharacterized protein H6S33_006622 [Morchella sextelata]|uniref:uncharacterized protein n=1 Tax=Morchella sextelata TaxID=1174677 RepID=UPI001D056B98|nr:uncharacterized protein H6S33_006622 [Morchella sextelata]KAH0604245.1 hypothetical protein H6S33_006622 [Morchella sextelata]